MSGLVSNTAPRKILVVDDEEDVRSLIETILVDVGYEVELAANGIEALERMAARRPDLVTLDLHMPRLNGWQVLDRMAQMPDPPVVIVLSGRAIDPSQRQGLRAFVRGLLSKPFVVQVLLSTIETALQERPIENQQDERRCEPRRPLVAEATIMSKEGNAVMTGRIQNLSTRGAQLNVGAPIDPGTNLNVAVKVPDQEHPINSDGQVRWRQEHELGFKFEKLGSVEERRIQDLLKSDDDKSS